MIALSDNDRVMSVATAKKYPDESPVQTLIRLYPTQRERLQAAARAEGVSWAEWVRRALDEKLERDEK